MRTKLITPPTDLPVSDLEARLHLRNPENTENSELIAFIRSAVEIAQHRTGLALMTQTWEAYLDSFPSYIELPHPPIQSVTSVKYFNSSDVETTLATTEYVVTTGEHGAIRLASGKTWPSVYARPEAVIVRYVAGYSDVDLVPASIVHWIALEVASADGVRSSMSEKQLYRNWDHLLDKHRVNLGV
jgi:uncharacterized phiE125 gp8 family phage protein